MGARVGAVVADELGVTCTPKPLRLHKENSSGVGTDRKSRANNRHFRGGMGRGLPERLP
jgi:hypothetical protein